MTIRNLTPHTVNLIYDGGKIVLQPELPLPRSREVTAAVGIIELDGQPFPLLAVRPGPVADLPAERKGVLLLVSRVVASAQPHRRDLIVPYDVVRDAQGAVTGCRALARIVAQGEPA